MDKIKRIISLVGALMLALGMSHGFAQQDYQPPKTEFGVPDVQGVWNFKTRTGLQRPETYAGELEMDAAAGAR